MDLLQTFLPIGMGIAVFAYILYKIGILQWFLKKI